MSGGTVTLSGGGTVNFIGDVRLAAHLLTLAGANDVTLGAADGTGVIDKENAGALNITGALGTGGVTLNAITGETYIRPRPLEAVIAVDENGIETLHRKVVRSFPDDITKRDDFAHFAVKNKRRPDIDRRRGKCRVEALQVSRRLAVLRRVCRNSEMSHG